MQALLFVTLGGAIGALGRFGIYQLSIRYLPLYFPFATLIVNVIGSFIIGILTGLLVHRFVQMEALRWFLIIGVLGSFTTFSSFSLETVKLLQMGHFYTALANIAANLSLCLLATFIGLWLSR